MKNLPIPIIVPRGYRIKITQPYGDASGAAWYQANGINIPFHNGVDIVIDSNDPRITYGSACFCPFPKGMTVKTTIDNPMSTKGNGITLQSEAFTEDGKEKIIQLVYWHLSSIPETSGHKYKSIVGYAGNSGLVNPAPSPTCPYCGSHLHLMMFEFFRENSKWVLQNESNGVNGAIDPMKRFSINVIEYGEDTNISFDVPPLEWAFKKLGLTEAWQKIVFAYKLFIKK